MSRENKSPTTEDTKNAKGANPPTTEGAKNTKEANPPAVQGVPPTTEVAKNTKEGNTTSSGPVATRNLIIARRVIKQGEPVPTDDKDLVKQLIARGDATQN